MIRIIRAVASLKVTLVGIIMLAAGAALSYDNRIDSTAWVIVVPLAFLSVNLLAAIFTNPRINRQPGLLVFHISLLGLVLLSAIGRLTYLDAHVEIVQTQPFDMRSMMEEYKGPFHAGSLEKVQFIQGSYTVDYEPGMQRGLTFSEVFIPDAQGNSVSKIVGDDRPLILEGYRFYTTFNKGFTVLLTWIPDQGEPETGTVNMPSYPLFDYKQDNSWTPTGGEEIKFWLQLQTGMDPEAKWRLDGRNVSGVLVVTQDKQRVELNPGDTLSVKGGQLRYEKLLTWMGYKIFYNPTIKWLFFVSMLSVLGMSWHYWKKMASKPWPDGVKDPGIKSDKSNMQGKIV